MVKYYVQAVAPKDLEEYLNTLEGAGREFVEVSTPSQALVVVTKDSDIIEDSDRIEQPKIDKGFLSFFKKKLGNNNV